MRGCHNKEEPESFSAWLAYANEFWQPSYPFNDSAVRADVVNSLFEQQRGLCVYCGRSLDRSSPGKSFHIEHFRPQHEYEALSVSFDNMYLSCGQKNTDGTLSQTCGTHKDSWFDELLAIEPNYPNCISLFSFSLNGDMLPSDGTDKSAQKMVEVLNLNHPELKKDREDLLMFIDAGELDLTDFWDGENNKAESYAHVAYHHLEMTLP
jgi:uncharacterized protein (TIGR02646 family)